MKRRRILGVGDSCYHVMSRVVERRFYLGEQEKEMFCDMLRRAAGFSGVRVLTYCVLDNHFHILIQVPERVAVDDDELMRRLRILYRGRELEWVLFEFEQAKGNAQWEKALRDRYIRRMHDLSEFMKTLKQRFALWFNRSRGREGALWNGRFKSVLVQGPNAAAERNTPILTMAAYIDLNAVRAGVVDDPKDYRWCGYAAAVAGHMGAQEGIGFLVGRREGKMVSWDDAQRWYRQCLYIKGEGEKEYAFSGERIKRVLDEGGRLPKGELLRCRVRYFCDGAVLGSRAFVDGVFADMKGSRSSSRCSGARKLRGGDWGEVYALRDLKKQVIGTTSISI